MRRGLNIAMIGQKSIPARFGGIETHVEQLATRLAARGHDVSVYCRDRYKPGEEEIAKTDGFRRTPGGLTYRGVRLIYRPGITTKHLDAASHTFLCAAESVVRGGFDIVHFHGIGPSAFVPVARLGGRTVISTVHALDWRQVKWGTWAKRALLGGEATGIRSSHGVVAVSRILVGYIENRYGVGARYIPNGAAMRPRRAVDTIRRWGLEGNDYILTVGRIIRDRGLHDLLEAFAGVRTSVRLVIVGSEHPQTGYSRHLREMADDRVIFIGDLYGEPLEEMYSNCRFYVLASEVEGLPITPCEAMAFGRCVLLSDIPENMEVGGDVALYFKVSSVKALRAALQNLLNGDQDLAARGEAGRRRVESYFNWDRSVEALEAYYTETLQSRGRARR